MPDLAPTWMISTDEVDRGNKLGAAVTAAGRIGRDLGTVFEGLDKKDEAIAAGRETGLLVLPAADEVLPGEKAPLALLRQAVQEGWRVMMLSLGIDSAGDVAVAERMLGGGGGLPAGTAMPPEGPFDTPVPPAELRRRVSVGTEPTFLTSGALHVECYDACLRAAGSGLAAAEDLLEWGAGCGRMTIHLLRKAPAARITAADTDAEAIGWVRDNLPVAAALALPLQPPTELATDAFDRVVGHSVFSHLEVESQDRWLEELARVARPGGALAVSFNGPLGLRWHLDHPLVDVPDAARRETERDGIGIWREDGWDAEFYDGYHTTFHTHEYVREHWGQWFEVVAIHEGAATPIQDIAVLRPR